MGSAFDFQLVRRGTVPKALKRRSKMNHLSDENSRPTDVTFFIGPVGAPPNIKQVYQSALDRSAEGEERPLDEFLDTLLTILSDLAEGSLQEPSPLKQLVEAQIGHEIGEFSTYVAKGFMRRAWTPVVTIHLDRLKAPDGAALGHLVLKSHGEVIASLLGLIFKSEWIYTSWAYPSSPIDLVPTSRATAEKED